MVPLEMRLKTWGEFFFLDMGIDDDFEYNSFVSKL